MKFNYPKGHIDLKKDHGDQLKINQNSQDHITYGNRGMSLEANLNLTNEQYIALGIAVIHKKPTPIQVVSVDYPKRSAAKITEAYFRRPSTTDYNGVYQGKYIDFEAKETNRKKSFPLDNFHEHQIKHMKDCQDAGGICFLIVNFSLLDRLFLYPATKLFEWWDQQFQKNGRKSIPLSDIEQFGIEIEYGYAPRIPYLEALDQLIDKK